MEKSFAEDLKWWRDEKKWSGRFRWIWPVVFMVILGRNVLAGDMGWTLIWLMITIYITASMQYSYRTACRLVERLEAEARQYGHKS